MKLSFIEYHDVLIAEYHDVPRITVLGLHEVGSYQDAQL